MRTSTSGYSRWRATLVSSSNIERVRLPPVGLLFSPLLLSWRRQQQLSPPCLQRCFSTLPQQACSPSWLPHIPLLSGSLWRSCLVSKHPLAVVLLQPRQQQQRQHQQRQHQQQQQWREPQRQLQQEQQHQQGPQQHEQQQVPPECQGNLQLTSISPFPTSFLRLSPRLLAAHRPVGRRRMRETILVGRRQRSRQILLPPFAAPRELRVFFRVDYRTAMRLCGVRTPEPRRYIWRDEGSGRQFESTNRRQVLVSFAAGAHACKLFGLQAIPVDPEPDWPIHSSSSSNSSFGSNSRSSITSSSGGNDSSSINRRKEESGGAAVPVVALLGQINHGKTTLLDRLSGRLVAPFEAGGITQNISAVTVAKLAPFPSLSLRNQPQALWGDRIVQRKQHPQQQLLPCREDLREQQRRQGEKRAQQQEQQQQQAQQEEQQQWRRLTFIDTPGHASFKSMRGRASAGADVACVVIDVTAGKGLQTEEALLHADRYNLPVVFALNKCDALVSPFNCPRQAAAYAEAPSIIGAAAAVAIPGAPAPRTAAESHLHTKCEEKEEQVAFVTAFGAAAIRASAAASAVAGVSCSPPVTADCSRRTGEQKKEINFEAAEAVLLAKYELRRQCERLHEEGALRRDLSDAAMHAVCISALHGYGLQPLFHRLWEEAAACRPRCFPSATSTPGAAASFIHVKRRSDALVDVHLPPRGVGVILEISKSSEKGLLYTILVKQGRFTAGNFYAAGSAYGRIRFAEVHYAPPLESNATDTATGKGDGGGDEEGEAAGAAAATAATAAAAGGAPAAGATPTAGAALKGAPRAAAGAAGAAGFDFAGAAAALGMQKRRPQQQQQHQEKSRLGNKAAAARNNYSVSASERQAEELMLPGTVITCGVSRPLKSGGSCCVDDTIFVLPQERAFRLAEYRRGAEGLLRMQIAGPPLEISQWEADHPRLRAVYGTRAPSRAVAATRREGGGSAAAAAARDVRRRRRRVAAATGASAEGFEDEEEENLYWMGRETATQGRRAIEEWGVPAAATAEEEADVAFQEPTAAWSGRPQAQQAEGKRTVTAAAAAGSSFLKGTEHSSMQLFRKVTREEFEAPLSGRGLRRKTAAAAAGSEAVDAPIEEGHYVTYMDEEGGREVEEEAVEKEEEEQEKHEDEKAEGKREGREERVEGLAREGESASASSRRDEVPVMQRGIERRSRRGSAVRASSNTAAGTALPAVVAVEEGEEERGKKEAAKRGRKSRRFSAKAFREGRQGQEKEGDSSSCSISSERSNSANALLTEERLLHEKTALRPIDTLSSSSAKRGARIAREKICDYDSIAIDADTAEDALGAKEAQLRQQQQEGEEGLLRRRFFRDTQNTYSLQQEAVTVEEDAIEPVAGNSSRRSENRRSVIHSRSTVSNGISRSSSSSSSSDSDTNLSSSSSSPRAASWLRSTSSSSGRCSCSSDDDSSSSSKREWFGRSAVGRRRRRGAATMIAAPQPSACGVSSLVDGGAPKEGEVEEEDEGEEKEKEEEEEDEEGGEEDDDGSERTALTGELRPGEKKGNLHQPWAEYGDDQAAWQRAVEERNAALMNKWRQKSKQRALERREQQRRQSAMVVETEQCRREALGERLLTKDEIIKMMESGTFSYKDDQQGDSVKDEQAFLRKNTPVIPVILRSDVVGTFDVLLDELEKLQAEFYMRLPVVHGGIGPVMPRDVVHAEVERTYGYCPIYAFRVPVLPDAVKQALATSVVIKRFDFFVDVIDDVRRRCQNVQKLIHHNLYVRSLKTEPTRSGL